MDVKFYMVQSLQTHGAVRAIRRWKQRYGTPFAPLLLWEALWTTTVLVGLVCASTAALAYLLVRLLDADFMEWPQRAPQLRGLRDTGADNTLESFNASQLHQLDHLIMVAGHAVTMAESLDRADSNDGVWFLLEYQRRQDMPAALVGHIRRGVEVAAADPKSLLVFSGGQTRSEAGPRDEGSSYYRVAEHYRWWGASSRKARDGQMGLAVAQRTVTEEFATDSFQNLLYSICRFQEVVGHYPRKVTVVSFDFKRQRFAELHRVALRFPRAQFDFVGLQPPFGSRFNVERAKEGERLNAASLFEVDPYGCNSPTLAFKREERNPFRRIAPYPLSCPAMRDLLAWCGPHKFLGQLPWSESTPFP